jgi:hypothetical protein
MDTFDFSSKAIMDRARKNGIEAAKKKEEAQRAQDTAMFNEFKNQDFANPDLALYTPTYKTSPDLAKQQEQYLALFNARKDDILTARRTPGISQTRF